MDWMDEIVFLTTMEELEKIRKEEKKKTERPESVKKTGKDEPMTLGKFVLWLVIFVIIICLLN